jgi:hypothetical protein
VRTKGPAQLERARKNQLAAMNDVCLHRVRTWVENSVGELEEILVDDQSFPCGYNPGPTQEIIVGDQTITVTAMIRLSLTLLGTISPHDQVVLLQKNHEDLIRQPVFELVGEPQIGPMALRWDLVEIE